MTPAFTEAVERADPRPLYEPTDADLQQAMDVLSAHWNAQWEASRAVRTARNRQRAADWLAHADGCERRAVEYAEMGMHDKATDQRNKAAFARGMAEEFSR